MSDMQWRKANGETGEYTGPLMNLGHGIPRRMGDFGIRRALFDLAFGYVSGFPVRDILPFAWRSLFPPRRTLVAISVEIPDPGHVGTVHIACPVCGELMPATVSAEIENDEGAHLGEARLVCTPDMTDIHAHMWAHTETPA